MNNKKIIIISSIIIAVLVLTLGVTYSIFSLSKVSKNSSLVVGDIYMHYTETTAGINIENMVPMNEKTYNITGVDTSEEKVNICSKYLYSIYGYKNFAEKNENEKSNVKFITSAPTVYVVPSYNSADQYNDYCRNNLLMAYKENRLTTNDLEYLINQEVLKGTIINNVSNLNYFEFTIDGKNTHTKDGINYNIELVHGDIVTNKTRIKDKFLIFKLVEVVSEKEIILQNNISIEDINNTIIQSEWIPANTTDEISKTYRLYMWIDDSVNICGGEQTENCDYTITEWSKLFASIKVNVNGKYRENNTFVSKIKSKYNPETKQDGLVAVNTSGDLATSNDTIREYRYSGIGNYCTYTDGTNDYNISVSGSTCPKTAYYNYDDLNIKNNQTEPTDSGIRNYVTFNNETWRIVGIFNEENSNGIKEERIKLVKDEPISISADVPTTITKDGITYQMFKATSGTKYKYFYWNNPSNVETNYNDWTKAGSMYYLNENYLNSLENSAIIENMKYYLGNVSIKKGSVFGTSKQVYINERGLFVWPNNQTSWNGKVALLYPSDYGYASNTSNWDKGLNEAYSNGISLNNWMFNAETEDSWFLSPSAITSGFAVGLSYAGYLDGHWSVVDAAALRPVLSLGSQTMISSGTGSINDPYVIAAE